MYHGGPKPYYLQQRARLSVWLSGPATLVALSPTMNAPPQQIKTKRNREYRKHSHHLGTELWQAVTLLQFTRRGVANCALPECRTPEDSS